MGHSFFPSLLGDKSGQPSPAMTLTVGLSPTLPPDGEIYACEKQQQNRNKKTKKTKTTNRRQTLVSLRWHTRNNQSRSTTRYRLPRLCSLHLNIIGLEEETEPIGRERRRKKVDENPPHPLFSCNVSFQKWGSFFCFHRQDC